MYTWTLFTKPMLVSGTNGELFSSYLNYHLHSRTCPPFSHSRNVSQGAHRVPGAVLGARAQKEAEEGLVLVLEELRSRGTADIKTNSPKHVLGVQGWIWVLMTEEETLTLVLRIRTNGTWPKWESGEGAPGRGPSRSTAGAFQEQCTLV